MYRRFSARVYSKYVQNFIFITAIEGMWQMGAKGSSKNFVKRGLSVIIMRDGYALSYYSLYDKLL